MTIRRHLHTRSPRGRGNAQAHTKIKIRKFLLRGLWPFLQNFAPTKIAFYTVPPLTHTHIRTYSSPDPPYLLSLPSHYTHLQAQTFPLLEYFVIKLGYIPILEFTSIGRTVRVSVQIHKHVVYRRCGEEESEEGTKTRSVSFRKSFGGGRNHSAAR